MPIICWLRRDLRLHDNTALFHAAADSSDGVIPVFIFDDAILRHPDCGSPIVTFMLGCLRELRDGLRKSGGDLLLLHGNPVEQLRTLAAKTAASAVYHNKDYDPAAIARDQSVARELAKDNVTVRSFKDLVIFEQTEIVTASSRQAYTVYSPYKRAWLARLAEERRAGRGPDVLAKPKLKLAAAFKNARGIDLPSPADLGFTPFAGIEIAHGEAAGAQILAVFCAGPLVSYKKHRNFPAIEGVSRLSPHLRHGTVSARQALRAAINARDAGGKEYAEGADAWIGELIWREFYQQMLFNFPSVVTETFKPGMNRLKWRHSEKDFESWKTGRTGFPIVDAAMRQLNQTGWMHNRLRMITAMFLTKDLLIDYKWGERYFANLLIDFETAQNNGGWQWSASTGADAQPYFRIFNPTTQSQTCDPEGAFIRRYCPELSAVPTEFIHAPHEMPPLHQELSKCRIETDYPAPMVDHAEARAAALKMFKGA
jgi:deoxyribodipyrimidine photo-lyase